MTSFKNNGKPRLLGAMLAGGRSRRMGRDKAGLEIGEGRTMADSVLEALRGVCDDVVLLGDAAGIGDDIPRLDDLRPGQGPLAGIETLMRQRRADGYLVVPCDMPLVDADLLGRLPTPPAAGVSVFHHASGDTEPFPMRIDPSAVDTVTSWLDTGRRNVRGWLAERPTKSIAIDDEGNEQLANINRPGELETARRTARRRRHQLAVRHEDDKSAVVPVLAANENSTVQRDDHVAAEEPLQIQVGSLPIAVVMRTPGDDVELATGFLLTERLVVRPSDLANVRPCTETTEPLSEGNVIRARLADGVKLDAAKLQRNFYVSSSCGICGKASIEAAMAHGDPLAPSEAAYWSRAELVELPGRMRDHQAGFVRTGGLHAAGLFGPGGDLLVVREDVGRHNAVDKVLGWAARSGLWPPREVVLAVSGRVSFEIVQKAVAANVTVICAVSAPTSLAVQLATEAGVAIVGFVRGKRCNVYGDRSRLPALSASG